MLILQIPLGTLFSWPKEEIVKSIVDLKSKVNAYNVNHKARLYV